MEKAVITVIGNDRTGIIYNVTGILYECNVNIVDLSQTILNDLFTMVMIVDIEKCNVRFEELQNRLDEKGKELALQIKIQHQAIFDSMHNI